MCVEQQACAEAFAPHKRVCSFCVLASACDLHSNDFSPYTLTMLLMALHCLCGSGCMPLIPDMPNCAHGKSKKLQPHQPTTPIFQQTSHSQPPLSTQHCSEGAVRLISNCKQDIQHLASISALLQGPDMTNPCCKVWLDGAKATPVDDRPDRPPGCSLVSPSFLLQLWTY